MRHHCDGIPNSLLIELINEWVKKERDRQILIRRFVDGCTFEKLAEERGLSVQHVKRIVYKEGDKILLKAALVLK